MDIYHKLFSVARREKLHSPHYTIRDEHGVRIMDLGCGTGIWAIDMAEWVDLDRQYGMESADSLTRTYQKAKVHGIDLEFIQPAL